ncbi:MAG TPA: hypothetical protein VJ111_02390 [Chitinophagaceae bacterium]|nr:hypothetical protein [Chitinophagaceae bacterium]
MKVLLTILLISSTLILSAQSLERSDYSIILGDCFNRDTVSLSINNHAIFTNYTIENTDSLIKGNLSLTQYIQGIRINYNGKEKILKAIPVDYLLEIKVTVNRKINRFSLDMRKGNIILLDFCPEKVNQPATRKLTASQLQEPFLLM